MDCTSSIQSILRTSDDKIVDGQGKPVSLRGAGLGGWMNQKTFITGTLSTRFLEPCILLTSVPDTLEGNSRFARHQMRCGGRRKQSFTGIKYPHPIPYRWLTQPLRGQFLEYFFTPSDVAFFRSLGLNCIRIAINYRHF